MHSAVLHFRARPWRRIVSGVRREDSGFTLAELVIASSLLLVVGTAVLGSLSYAATASAAGRTRSAAVSLLNQRIEQARNFAYDDVGVRFASGGYGDPVGEILTPEVVGVYKVVTDVSWERDASGHATYKRMKVTVSWSQPRAGQVTASTIIFGRSLLVNTGDALFHIQDRDTGAPIDGATFTLTPSAGAARSITTTPGGDAFFGYVPAGPVVVQATRSGYLIDDASFRSASVAATLLTSVVVYAQKPSRAIVVLKTSSGAAVPGAIVNVTNGAGIVTSVTTAADGTAVFGNLFVGSYSVTGGLVGGSPAAGTFLISRGDEEVTCMLAVADPGDLTVRVTDQYAAPQGGASIHIRGPQPSVSEIAGSPRSTESNGETSFSALSAGTYVVEVSRDGFSPWSGSITVAAGSNPPLTVTLQPIAYGNLLITTVNNGGNPRGNVRVRVWNTATGYDNTTLYSDAAGQISLTGLIAGTYQVYAYSNPAPKTVYVIAGTTASVMVQR